MENPKFFKIRIKVKHVSHWLNCLNVLAKKWRYYLTALAKN